MFESSGAWVRPIVGALSKETLMARKILKASPRKRALSVVSATTIGGETLPDGATSAPSCDVDSRRALIERAAYLRAERRGFEPGHELEDWCAAELEIDDQLFRGEIAAG
jgi:hypothetical protein